MAPGTGGGWAKEGIIGEAIDFPSRDSPDSASKGSGVSLRRLSSSGAPGVGTASTGVSKSCPYDPPIRRRSNSMVVWRSGVTRPSQGLLRFFLESVLTRQHCTTGLLGHYWGKPAVRAPTRDLSRLHCSTTLKHQPFSSRPLLVVKLGLLRKGHRQ